MRLYSCKHAMDEEAPGPCKWCEGNLLNTMKCLTEERDVARAGLRDLFALMDEKILVRNTDHDADPNWAMKILAFGSRLSLAYQAIGEVESHEDNAK